MNPRTLLLLLLLFCVPLAAENPFEVVAEVEIAPGNIAVTPAGRKFVSAHPFVKVPLRVFELLPDGKIQPYPNFAWASAPGSDGRGIESVIGIESDPRGILWMVDMSLGNDLPPRLVGWDTVNERLERLIHLPKPVSKPDSFIQDLAIEHRAGKIYLADCMSPDPKRQGSPAIIVVDLKTGLSRRILEDVAPLQAEDVDLKVEGRTIEMKRADGSQFKPRIGLNPITIDPEGRYLYFGAMNGTKIYRVRTDDLNNPRLQRAALAEKIEVYAPKPVSDGISVDGSGNIYVTDLNNNAIGIASDGAYRVHFKHPDLLWPDGMSYGPDGYFYVTVNQLHRTAALNLGNVAIERPFKIIRFKPLAKGAVGR